MANQQYFATYVQDLEQEPFDPTDLVERLAWRLTGGTDQLEPRGLYRAFEEEIGSLQLLSDQYQAKIARLENQCQDEQLQWTDTLERLQKENKQAVDTLKDVDSTMRLVAGKVVHLGDQLESINGPRTRAFEALQLMRHFDEFLSEQPLHSDVFTDPDKLLESAEIIHKLSAISQELSTDKFARVQARIAYKYDEIERLMIEEFVRTHRLGNRSKMRQIAGILSNFKGYSQCLDAFVEHIQIGAFRTADIFQDTLTLCEKTYPLLEKIFPNSEQVMSKLVLNIFHGKLQEYIHGKLSDAEKDDDLETYLSNLQELYTKTQRIASQLERLRLGSHGDFLSALIRSIFGRYLGSYMHTEIRFLKEQCSALLQRFYESKRHQKRHMQSGGLQELKRDIQARIMNVQTFGGETFLSEEVAINILQETKLAFQRCQTLSSKESSSANTEIVLDVLLKYLCTEHLEYAVELGLSAEGSSVRKKDAALQSLESRLSAGLDRQLQMVVGYVRFILSAEQKKTDFRPDDHGTQSSVPLCSTACTSALRFISVQVLAIQDSLDGANLLAALCELGIRIHNALLSHIHQFVYSTLGAMLLLCDINEYRKTVARWEVPLLNRLFETLHALANLLVVVPGNLTDAFSAQMLNDIDRSIIVNFVQLRSDYRSSKLYNDFR